MDKKKCCVILFTFAADICAHYYIFKFCYPYKHEQNACIYAHMHIYI